MFFIIGIICLLESARLFSQQEFIIGSSLFPFLIGTLLIILSEPLIFNIKKVVLYMKLFVAAILIMSIAKYISLGLCILLCVLLLLFNKMITLKESIITFLFLYGIVLSLILFFNMPLMP